MNTGQRTIASLLAVITVLLGLNLIVKGSPPAQGQVPAGSSGACCLPNGDCTNVSQATCESYNGVFHGLGVTCFSVNCVPVKPPTVVAGHAVYLGLLGADEGNHQLFRFWSDGAVDTIRVHAGPGCDLGPPCTAVVLPGACAADVTRNGEVEIGDFLEVLGQWGPCR